MPAMPKPPRVSPLALSFQTDLELLIAEPAPRSVRIWPALGLGLLVSLGTAAAFLPVDVVITATGRISADAPPMLLRPSACAVLQELLVRPGYPVVAGQVLARPDAALLRADRDALAAESRSLRAEIARYEVEMSGTTLSGASAEMVQQSDILAQRIAAAHARLNALSATNDALKDEATTLASMAPALAECLAIAQQVEAMRQELDDRRSIPQIDTLAARAARLEAELEAFNLRARQPGPSSDDEGSFGRWRMGQNTWRRGRGCSAI
jgi:hemolysin D